MKTRILSVSVTLLLFAITAAIHPCAAQQVEQPSNPEQAPPPATAPTAELITAIHPGYFSSYSNPLTRTPSILLRFNTGLDPETVGKTVYFVDNSGQRLAAVATRATPEQALPLQNASSAPAYPAEHFVQLQPAEPLAFGRNWILVVPAGLHNATATHRSSKVATLNLGTIHRFEIKKTEAITSYANGRHLQVYLNKRLDQSMTAERLAELVQVSPQPANLKLENYGNSIGVRGDFELARHYRLVIRPGLLATDATRSETTYHSGQKFSPDEPFVTMPAFSAPQLSNGERKFIINSGNLENFEVNVKKLDDRDLIYALRGYDAYTRDRIPPYEMIPGETIWSETVKPLKGFDRIQTVTLDWRKVLAGTTAASSDPTPTDSAAATPAALYVFAEGDSKLHRDGRRFGGQAIIQLTDIGLAWKRDLSHELIYAFSLSTGKPLANVSLELVDNDAGTLRKTTSDAHGLARLPRVEDIDDSRWLLAKYGDDRHVLELTSLSDTIGLWRFGMPYRYQDNDADSRRQLGRRNFVFTDRPLYEPGDEVYLKSHTRLTDFDSLLPADTDRDNATEARLRVFDARHRAIIDTRLAVSEFGSLDHHFTLPEEGLGRYRIELDFNSEDVADNNKKHRYDLVFHHSILVAEYRPNTFEITLTPPADGLTAGDSTSIDIPVSAAYFMGKPLSKARLQWHASFRPWQPQARGFDGFSFAHRKSRPASSFSEELDLNPDGSGTISITLPAGDEYRTPMHVNLDAEITDINQQTVSTGSDFTIHTSDHYLGIRTPDETPREKQPIIFEIAAIDPGGQALTDRPVAAKLSVEKIINYTVKVRAAGGAMTTRSRVRYEPVYEASLDVTTFPIDPDTGVISGTRHDFTPAEPGNYQVTVTTEDEAGKILTAASSTFSVLGDNDTDWSYRDELRLTLTPEKKHYQPGDMARFFIDTPVLGTALVSVERSHVRETFTCEITRNRDVLEIPVPADGAPNLFVSVLVIRGADDSPHQHRTAAFRLGYAEIDIDDPGRALSIDLQPSQPSYEPADAIDVVATVSDATGRPLPNTEVTLYAVDEGVLSLTGYQTPDPDATLNAPYELIVATGQNLTSVLSEDPEQQDFGNKGYVIGGGGMDDGATPNDRVRRNFKALAFWQGSLITDPAGRVQASFTAPDNLTEYRLIAVAANADRFASAETPITINKPLIVEPSLPAFANVGDRIDLRAVLHNNTERRLTLDVSLELDDIANFASDDLPKIIPAQFAPATDTTRRRSRRIDLAAGETSALTFPVQFKNIGTAKWQWHCTTADDSTLADHVETELQVGYPLPLLRESHQVTVTAEDKDADILSRISPHLLNGRGKIDVTVSNSRLIETQDALDYLLKYPYGCVEQTTSSTLPWLSTQNLRDALPALKKTDAEIATAIAAGTRRLLTMQTHDGGLGYWPGASEPVLWGSAYGGMAIALAVRSGTDLPAEPVEKLWSYLSKNLRKTGELKKPYDLSQRCLALYTLALAGKAEPAYHDLLYQRRDSLPDEARALLALAIIESSNGAIDSDDSRARTLLADNATPLTSGVTWYGDAYRYATRILAWSKLDPNSETNQSLINSLLAQRHGKNAWGSTYSNAWPLLALTTHARSTLSELDAAKVDVHFAGQTHQLDLANKIASGTAGFSFDGDRRRDTLTLSPFSNTPLYAHVEIESLPDLTETAPVNRGFDIKRRYQKIAPDGALTAATELSVGDLVLISLDLTIPEKQNYLAIDDPLPAIFEAVNPKFKTQTQQNSPRPVDWRKHLHTSHTELRKDRALFFSDYVYRAGDYQIQYLARVVATGEATAPAAKIEAMYEPQRYGLSATTRIAAQSSIPDADQERRAASAVAAR